MNPEGNAALAEFYRLAGVEPPAAASGSGSATAALRYVDDVAAADLPAGSADPLAAVWGLLRPRAVGVGTISPDGDWAEGSSRRDAATFSLVLAGRCLLAADGDVPVLLGAGDFVLLTPGAGFEYRDAGARSGNVLLVGYLHFTAPELVAEVRLLPPLVYLRADAVSARVADTVRLLADEAVANRAGREAIIGRLIEVLLIEALRTVPSALAAARSGLLAGLAEPRLAQALRAFHADIAGAWTVATLAQAAGMSRSMFSEHFAATLGLPPMDYLLRWRMAVARDRLRQGRVPLERVAAEVGYRSVTAFGTAFRRVNGVPPGALSAARR